MWVYFFFHFVTLLLCWQINTYLLSESEEDQGFRRRSVQSRRQSCQKEKRSDIEGEISKNYRLAEEHLNKYVGASETSKKEFSKSNGAGHDKNRTEQNTETRNDKGGGK